MHDPASTAHHPPLPTQHSPAPPPLPHGVGLMPLTMNADDRGVFTEVFRRTWGVEIEPVQWNFVASRAGVLRGVHVHLLHSDYLILLTGRARIGLCDLRPGSPTQGLRSSIEMSGQVLQSLVIPPGVAHGFYFHEPSHHLYAVSAYWSAADELGCHFADPALGLAWPSADPLISERDALLPPLTALAGVIPAWRPRGPSPPAGEAEPTVAAAAR